MTDHEAPRPGLPLVELQRAPGRGLLVGLLLVIAAQSAASDPWWWLPLFFLVLGGLGGPVAWGFARVSSPESGMDEVVVVDGDQRPAARRSGYRQALAVLAVVVRLQAGSWLARGDAALWGTGALGGVGLSTLVRVPRLRRWEEVSGRRLWVRTAASPWALTRAQGRRRLVAVASR